MKKFLSVILAVLLLIPFFSGVVSSAKENDKVALNLCVTWLLKPERSNSALGIYNYVAEYYKTGETPNVPDFIPEYETQEYYCVFEYWTPLKTVSEIVNYLDGKTSYIPINAAPVSQPDFEPLYDDITYGPIFRTFLKRYAIDGDKVVSINDVSALLDVLSGKTISDPGPGLQEMYDSGTTISILQVSMLLNYLSLGEG